MIDDTASKSRLTEIQNQDITVDEFINYLKEKADICYKYFSDNKYKITYEQKIQSDTFIAHQNQIWGECFAVSETMYVMTVEAAEKYSKFVNENISDDLKKEKQYTFLTLQYMHGRCCQEFLEILNLMRLGFADCAYARWRSMYELCCNASFISKHGENIAKQFFEQAPTENHKYDWTKGAKKEDGTELKINSFKDIQDNCDIDKAWKKQYKLACFVNHGSPQGTFKRLSLKNSESIIAVGQSDYGMTTPAEHSAISLQVISSLFFNVFQCSDAMIYEKVIYDWVKEVRKAYFSTSDKVFGRNLNQGG